MKLKPLLVMLLILAAIAIQPASAGSNNYKKACSVVATAVCATQSGGVAVGGAYLTKNPIAGAAMGGVYYMSCTNAARVICRI